jgi:pyruvate,orthophosphate dikinase
MTSKLVFGFGGGSADGGAKDRNLLGGKGANLAEMASIGLAVPPGFTITTEVCTYHTENQTYPESLKDDISLALKKIEDISGAKFGDSHNPLLVSVRSGSKVSMPGMMDTVLNLGLNHVTVKGLEENSGNANFAWDSYRRFIQMYSDVVLGVSHYHFEDLIEMHKEDKGLIKDTDLEADDWKKLCGEFLAKVEEEYGKPFPQDPFEQLWGAIGAVFASWNVERAKTYRRLHAIPEHWGTAVNVQAMVFGNMGDTSATGVAFTRNPSTGEHEYYGEYLINAQGEDVVAGIRTPQFLTEQAKVEAGAKLPSMEATMPDVYQELTENFDLLENHYHEMQDIEFTVQKGKLWLLQTRTGKRTAKAALKIAIDMVGEGKISKEEALLRIEAKSLDQLLHPTIDPDAAKTVLTLGLPASPGAASGKVYFTADEAERQAATGVEVILVRVETSPEDIHGMHAANGILTSRGGMTSHAAVVARGMGRACVAGAGSLDVNIDDGFFRVGGQEVRAGDIITLDGSTGEVMLGEVARQEPELSGEFGILMKWADEVRTMRVRANAETPKDVQIAYEFGAEGIGLCRTEHMFFDSERIVAVRQMILADDIKGREEALVKLLPMQRGDFAEIFEIMKGLPVTIRLLDPPLHEFLPREDQEFKNVAKGMNVSVDKLKRRANELHESNPMLGHRGCRLGFSYPEIYEMQARAIFEGAFVAQAKTGQDVVPEIMVPLVALKEELDFLKDRIDKVAKEVFNEKGREMDYFVGTMIELPSAAIRAGDIAETAEFFSFGTNDLTQTTLGVSRDDSQSFISEYLRQHIIHEDPFVTLDFEGVGELIKMAVERGRKTRPDIKMGICGEHGGDPRSIGFFQSVGLDYVSCSPYRVPIARLAAAQAVLKLRQN